MNSIIIWSHGSSMQIEYSNRITSVRHTGPFVRIEGKSGQNTWGHFPITNPVSINDSSLYLTKILISFRTRNYGFINEILAYDGEKIIFQHTNLQLQGANLETEFNVPNHPILEKGLNIALGLQFKSDPPNMRDTQVEIIAVGVELSKSDQ